MNLDEFLLREAPPRVFYVPRFITSEEEAILLKNVETSPKPKWTHLSNRRLQNWGGIPHPKGMIAEKIPEWLQVYVNKVKELNVFGGKSPNHVLVNEYLSGQGIMPHTDGPLFYPTITTISCGSHTVLKFSPRSLDEGGDVTRKSFCVLLERCSLVIIQADVYENYLHSIEEVESDNISEDLLNLKLCKGQFCVGQDMQRGTRVSLTIRHVPFATKPIIRLSK